MPKLLLSALITHWFLLLLGTPAALLAFLLPENKLSQISSRGWAIIVFLLLIGLLIMIAFYISLRKKIPHTPDRKEYDFIDYPPVYIHKKEKSVHCYSCLFNVGYDRSRMGIIPNQGLICPACGNVYLRPWQCKQFIEEHNLTSFYTKDN